MTSTAEEGSTSSTNWFEQQQQQQQQELLLQNSSERQNGNSSHSAAIRPYPPPTALYDELTRDANLFWEKLKSFHDSYGTKFKVPTIGGSPLDLYRLFVEVTSRGGLEKVIEDRKWKDVILGFKFRDTITSASFMVRRYYLSLLYHFEQVYYFRKQVPPSSTPDPANKSLVTVSNSTIIKEGAAMNDLHVQDSPSPVQQLGSVLPGTIDGKFDGGYIVTVNIGSEQVKGILYQVPVNVSQSSYTEGVPSPQNRKRSRLALRDPSRPKSNRSGYNFFFAEHYARLKPSFFGQERAISKRIGFLWSNLTEAERQVYQEKGVRDKERYRSEMLEYKSNHSTPQPQ